MKIRSGRLRMLEWVALLTTALAFVMGGMALALSFQLVEDYLGALQNTQKSLQPMSEAMVRFSAAISPAWVGFAAAIVLLILGCAVLWARADRMDRLRGILILVTIGWSVLTCWIAFGLVAYTSILPDIPLIIP